LLQGPLLVESVVRDNCIVSLVAIADIVLSALNMVGVYEH